MKSVGLVLGPALALILLLAGAPESLSFAAWGTACLLVWMAVWWATEAIPIPATSLLPRSSALFGALLPALTVVALCLVGLVPTGLRGFWGPRLKLQRRIFTGCMMGILVTLWIFSGTWAFIGVFAAMAVVA